MKDKRGLITSQNSGFFQDLIRHIKLIFRLLGDKRVNFFLKILPVAAVIYLVAPVDLVPGLVLPMVGALDDAAILWLGTSLFISLCPDDVVREHMGALEKVVDSGWEDAEKDVPDEIVDAQAQDAPALLGEDKTEGREY